jgi:hypothetical protein
MAGAKKKIKHFFEFRETVSAQRRELLRNKTLLFFAPRTRADFGFPANTKNQVRF